MSQTEFSRLLLKRATFPGVLPTIPTGSTISNTWLPTDLLEGELFLNAADDRLWVRTANGIQEIAISGISSANYYTTSAYLSGSTVFFNRTDLANAYSVDLSGLPVTGSTGTDYYVTGGTFNAGTLTLDRQNGSVTITGFTSDIYTTGFTYDNANTLTISDNGGNNYSATINTMTGLTINGSISATTYQNLPIDPDNYVTGGTFSSGTLTLNRQNGSVTITGFTDTIFTGGTGSCITDLYVSNIIGCSPLTIFSDTSITGFTTGGSYTAKDVNSGGDRLKRTITKSATGEISELDQQLDRLKFDSDANNGNLYTSTQMIDYIEFNTYNDTSKYQGIIKYVEGVGIELSETKTDTGEYYRLTLDKIGNEIISDDNSGTTANFVNNIVGNTLTTTNGTNTSSIDNNSTNTIISTDNGTQNSYLDTQYNSIQAVTTDTASGDFGNLTLNPTSLQLTSLEGTFNNKSVINITPIQTTASAYDDSLAANVTSITLLNTSTDGSAIITAIGNTSVLSQDTLSLDPLNGSYLRSQSTTSIPYTELAFNYNDITIQAWDGVNGRNITLVSTGITVGGGVANYDGDYSSQYTNRSIVDKEYVDSVVGGSTFTGGTVSGNTSFISGLTANELIVGNPGNEGSGININGLTFESSFKVSDIDGTNYAQTILHRHSTTLEPVIVGARSNSNTSSHSGVTNDMKTFTIYGAGWNSNAYNLNGQISIGTNDTGTLSSTSSPGKIELYTTPNGSVWPELAMKIDSNKNTTIYGSLTATTISATTYNGDGKNLLGVGGGRGSFGITIDGGGSAITTGVKGYITVPYNGTITGWDIFGDTTGSIVVDVWKDTYANFPPTVADTIAGTEKPTLSSAVKNQDTNLTSWTTSVTAGDIVAFNVDSAATVTRVNLIIYITKS